MAKLGRDFFARPTLLVAPDLLGKYLHFQGKVGKIVEVEAYLGSEDLGSHARSGRTRRNATMFGPPGHAYVYFTYGIHYLINLTTEEEGVPGAVLVRALEPVEGITGSTNGPAKLTKALGLNLAHNGLDAVSETLYIEDKGELFRVATSPRIGIPYAGDYARKPWRFFVPGNPYLSR